MPTLLTEKLEAILHVKKTPSLEEKELFQKAQSFVQCMQWIPGLRMVAVSNSLAMYATHKESDIDLFIVTAPRRIWIVRTLVLLIATLLGVRTKPGDEAGKFCFPFFMTDKNLSLRNIAIDTDIYLAYWICTLKPLYNKHYTYGRFMKMNEAFCEKTLGMQNNENDQYALLEENRTFLTRTRRGAFFDNNHIKNPVSPLLDILDAKLGNISLKRIQKQKIPAESMAGTRLTENMVKLHFHDRRAEIRDQVMNLSV